MLPYGVHEVLKYESSIWKLENGKIRGKKRRPKRKKCKVYPGNRCHGNIARASEKNYDDRTRHIEQQKKSSSLCRRHASVSLTHKHVSDLLP
jgi:hypothetical protein